MKSLRTIVFGLACLFVVYGASAQVASDSAIHLQELVIRQSRLDDYSIGHNVLRVDSATLSQSASATMADIMRKFGIGHVRSYGPGGLSTPSFRGTNANHTTLLWNGINLQSPLNGQADFTLIPMSFLGDLHFQLGGSASLYGNGAIGGTIHLNSKANFNQGMALGAIQSAGSFSSFFTGTSFRWSGKKFISDTRFFDISAQNNFWYLNNNVAPVMRLRRDHNKVLQRGLLQENHWQFAPGHLLSLRFWLQGNNIEVPNAISISRPAMASQRDEFVRSVLSWQFDRQHLHLSYQASHVHHALLFEDELINLHARSTFESLVNSAETTVNIRKGLDATAGVIHTFERGFADEFSADSPQRNRTALLGALKIAPAPNWKTALSFRQEFIDALRSPFAFSAGTSFAIARHWGITGNASRSYRIPTFNDLYWRGPGAVGNPRLLAEESWSEELAVQYARSNKNISTEIRIGVFNNDVDNWVLWTPTLEGWSPFNVRKVWGRGIESRIYVEWRTGEFKGHSILVYNFVKTTNSEVYDNANLNELGKQLILTPQHEGSLTLRGSFKNNSLSVVGACTGKQYTDGNNNEFFAMKPYLVWSTWLSRSLTTKKLASSLTLELNNIFNTNYAARPGYPLPGRNFKVTLSILLHTKSNKNVQ